jgi:hypothetical protein
MQLTGSSYGYFGEVLDTASSASKLPSITIQCILEKKGSVFLQQPLTKPLAAYLSNIDTPFGTAVIQKQLLINNDIGHNVRHASYINLPPELADQFPNLHNFVGIPLFRSSPIIAHSSSLSSSFGSLPSNPLLLDRSGTLRNGGSNTNIGSSNGHLASQPLLGIFGLANREQGFSEEYIKSIQHFLGTCEKLIEAHINTRMLREVQEKEQVYNTHTPHTHTTLEQQNADRMRLSCPHSTNAPHPLVGERSSREVAQP